MIVIRSVNITVGTTSATLESLLRTALSVSTQVIATEDTFRIYVPSGASNIVYYRRDPLPAGVATSADFAVSAGGIQQVSGTSLKHVHMIASANQECIVEIGVGNGRTSDFSDDSNITVGSITATVSTDLETLNGAAINVNGGAIDTGTQTITLATDDPAVTSLANIEASVDGLEGTVPVPPYTHSSARGDFVAAYTSNVTITITGAPTLTNEQLSFILVTDTAGTTTTRYVNGQNGVAMSTSANVITITGAGTPFASGDTYDVGVNLQDKGYDADLDVNKNVVQNPTWARNTSPEAYTVFAPDDATYDEGAVISTAGYNYLNLAYSKSASDADDTNIKVIYLMTADSAVDFQETSISAPAGGVTTIDDNIYQRDKAALVEILTIPTKGFPFMRIDMAKTADTGTDSTITTYVNKSYL